MPSLHKPYSAWSLPMFAEFILLFSVVLVKGFITLPIHQAPPSRTVHLSMVRNIDLPEALIIYGSQVMLDPSVAGSAREGLSDLIQECHDVDTAVIWISDTPDVSLDDLLSNSVASSMCTSLVASVNPPNPRDLLYAVETTTVQPRPFGGSSGFGAKPADPERNPLPQHCVVLTSTIDMTRAARASGMRVISVDDGDDLADFVLFQDYIDFGVDDIATPGSFWLNPPHPRDDEGNRVDPYELAVRESSGPRNTETEERELDDDELDAILADMAPLK